MASVLDPRHAKHQHYRFPLSPPSSGTVTALSSPRLTPTVEQVPQIVDNLFPPSSFRQSHSPTSVRSGKQRESLNLTDSDGYNTEKYSHISSRKRSRNVMNRTLTHPLGTESMPRTLHHGRSSPTASKPLSRASSSTSSSSSSYFFTDREETAVHYPNVGMGRKVAATLQLFKETSGPSEDPSSCDSSRAEVTLGNRRVEPFQEVEDVAEAFEFVKRSEWPARETAAIRRERSLTLMEQSKSRDSSINDHVELERKLSLRETPLYDPPQWRRDHPAMSRGRRQERAFDEDADRRPEDPLQTIHPFTHESSPIFIRPRSRAYPPSPSPSPSPSSRTPFSHHVQETAPLSSVPAIPMAKHPHLPPLRITTRYSRSPTPVRTAHPNGYASNPLSPLSSWSTDDESMWETASNTSTVASNTSIYGYPSSTNPSSPSTLLQQLPETLQVSDTSKRFSHFDQEDSLNITPLGSIDDGRLDGTLAVNVNRPEERLPHIPLRPFRNQVGGHSAIYKFTKQAVCKVRLITTAFFNVFLNVVFSH